ncbi:anthranilate phosphoribosyltransferase [Methylovirgula sp. 4M-Z18]|uniref:anthranilate phosphoribosyltransferase n=1 Tax=Methylovirgula sp. 4M-Z18 TaxID=2293567 RepID=UPI000E2EC7FF|nr:anthranilate phosphoribosyltransferase [Methylovirgula sp. 4M-Z18]RFB80208.1 anthranilate phosphoribosyltransferase [Methylovirgula sp. 4M-Z18]
MDAFKTLIAKILNGAALSRVESEMAFDALLSGEVTPAQMGAFLAGLRVRGETADEITGAVTAMRSKMLRVSVPSNAIDVVGTGGDASGSYNVSTLASIIVAACGVPVAKHGNRAASSRSGASDVLVALGVKIGISPDDVAACVREAGVGFMWAQTHHAAMRHVAPVRTELGARTILNILGPLANPGGVKRQLTGVFSAAWLEPMVHVLKNLGSEKVWLVHGSDGLDEITTTGPTRVVALDRGKITSFEITPEDIGVARADPAALKGGDAEYNAAALRAVLDGAPGAYRDIAIFNAAGALVVADKAADLRAGAELAAEALDSGRAKAVLSTLVAVSNRSSTGA